MLPMSGNKDLKDALHNHLVSIGPLNNIYLKFSRSTELEW